MGTYEIEIKKEEDNTIKQCTDCNRVLPLKEFSPRKDNRTGKTTLQSKCKKCMSKISIENAKKRKEELEALRVENKELKETIKKLQGDNNE